MRVRVSDCKLFDGTHQEGLDRQVQHRVRERRHHGNEAEAAACTMKTLQDLTGITFDHYAVVDFAGFENMINAVDGVPMCVPKAIKDRSSKLHIKAGAQVLSGKTALAYARVRHIGDGTDLAPHLAPAGAAQQPRQEGARHERADRRVPQLTLLLKSASESMTMDPDLGLAAPTSLASPTRCATSTRTTSTS